MPLPELSVIAASSAERYRALRDELVSAATPSDAARLARAAHEADRWQEHLCAVALLLWLEQPALCAAVMQFASGELPHLGPPPSITGRWSVHERAAEIAALGLTAVPRILELVWKSPELDRDAFLSLLLALELLRDERAVPPLYERLVAGAPPARASSALALAHLGAIGAIPRLISIVTDRSEPPVLRAECARALAILNARESVALLLERAADRGDASIVRTEAASAAATLDAPAAVRSWRTLASDDDPALTGRILLELSRHGDAESLALLQAVAETDSNRAIAGTARDAAATLAARLRAL
jgi:hypothetical protein